MLSMMLQILLLLFIQMLEKEVFILHKHRVPIQAL